MHHIIILLRFKLKFRKQFHQNSDLKTKTKILCLPGKRYQRVMNLRQLKA